MHLTELAFAEIYHETFPLLRKYAKEKFGTSFLDEALSLAFQQFWDHREKWDDQRPGFPVSLLKTLVWSRASDLYRSAKVNPCSTHNENVFSISNFLTDSGGMMDTPFDMDLTAEDHLDCTYDDSTHHLYQAIRMAVTSLPFPQAEVVRLCYFQGLTCVQAAEHLHCPLGTIKARLTYAYAKLRPLLSHVLSRSHTF